MGSSRYAVSFVDPTGYCHAYFVELAFTLREALTELGHDAIVCSYTEAPERRHIVLGGHMVATYGLLPPHAGSVLYNTEVVGSAHISRAFIGLMQSYPVWDYDPVNTERLRAAGVQHARCLPVGAVPGLRMFEAPGVVWDRARLARFLRGVDPGARPDVVLFGGANARRRRIFEALAAAGVDARIGSGIFGAPRERILDRARIALNLHCFDAAIFEAVRVSYLLARGRFVVCETSTHMPWSGAYVPAPYDELVGTCIEYLKRPRDRAEIAAQGHQVFMADRMAPRLGEALADASQERSEPR